MSRCWVTFTTWLAIFTWTSLAAPTVLRAEEDKPINVTFRLGGAIGSIAYVDDSGRNVKGTFGGVPLEIVWDKSSKPDFSILIVANTLLDMINSQLIRQGVMGGVAYHLFGGSRRFVRAGQSASYVSSNDKALSIVAYGGIQSFSATNKNNTAARVSGQVLETVIGLEYRYEFSEENGLTAEINSTLTTLPASTSRLETSATELLLGWRTLL